MGMMKEDKRMIEWKAILADKGEVPSATDEVEPSAESE
jgi:hypothetical protein